MTDNISNELLDRLKDREDDRAMECLEKLLDAINMLYQEYSQEPVLTFLDCYVSAKKAEIRDELAGRKSIAERMIDGS